MSVKRILLVEDDLMLLELLKIGIESEGLQVLTANNGEDAIRLVQNQSPAMIVLDLMMPVMDGIRFVRWLRVEEGNQIPVLVMSSLARDEMASELLAYGVNKVLCKPVDLATFLGAVNSLLQEA
jgi:DNA-binding response OmpR family regulator